MTWRRTWTGVGEATGEQYRALLEQACGHDHGHSQASSLQKLTQRLGCNLASAEWATLFADHGVYQKLGTTALLWVHAVASTLVHVLIWHKELKDKFGTRLSVWWKNRKRRG